MAEIQDSLLTHIAQLARLSLSPEETTSLARDLAEILKYAESLKSLDLEGVPPMSHATEGERFRPDEPQHALTRDQALENAPDRDAGLFRVPQVIGG
jgi:aspartyl-tRNA(Asn)/glutamyl-tRNA(Gln) amidotransferase subunit C